LSRDEIVSLIKVEKICPDCKMDYVFDDYYHHEGCPRINSCGQIGPPWIDPPWHPWPDPRYLPNWYENHVREEHAE
jgi:hypothetical protein